MFKQMIENVGRVIKGNAIEDDSEITQVAKPKRVRRTRKQMAIDTFAAEAVKARRLAERTAKAQ